MPRAKKTWAAAQKSRRDIINDINTTRNNSALSIPKGMDDKFVDCELLTAAIETIKVAQQQIRMRHDRELGSVPATRYVPAGGTDYGYSIPEHLRAPPQAWPFDSRFWAPGYPKYNLMRAAAYIIAELERLQRADIERYGELKELENKQAKISVPDVTICNGAFSSDILALYNNTLANNNTLAELVYTGRNT